MPGLSTHHLHTPDRDRAFHEALESAVRLHLAGYVDAARSVAEALGHPDSGHGGTHAALRSVLAVVRCSDDHTDPQLPSSAARSTAYDAHAARSAAELAAWANEESDRQFDWLLMDDADRATDGAVVSWSEGSLSRLPGPTGAGFDFPEYARFVDDTCLVLKDRLRRALGRPVDRVASAEIGLPRGSESFHHRRLSEVLAECGAGIGRPLPRAEQSCYLMAAALDLLAGDTLSAALHLRRVVNLGGDLFELARSLAYWPPQRDLLASHALAGTLRITEVAVADYLAAFAHRYPVDQGQLSPV